MKKTIALIIATVAFAIIGTGVFFVSGCSTDSEGNVTIGSSKNGVTIPAADVNEAEQITTDALNAALNGAANQFASTGSVNAKGLSFDSVSAIAKDAQGYVGTTIPPTVISSSPGVAQIGNAASKVLAGKTITQALVNDLNTAASKLAPGN